MNRLHHEASLRLAELMLKHIESFPYMRNNLNENAYETVAKMEDLDVVEAPHKYMEECGVAGHYQTATDGRPATITISDGTSVGRRNFTVLHELGHHLQRNTRNVAETLLELGADLALEEAACDAFAAEILIPHELLDQVVVITGINSQLVIALRERSSASLHACAVAAANMIPREGGGIVLTESGFVEFVRPVRGFIPPKRESDQSGSELFRRMSEYDTSGYSAYGHTTFRYSNGSESVPVYFHATRDMHRIVALVTRDGAPWEPFSPTIKSATSWRNWMNCAYCQEAFQAELICERCREYICPNRHCDCTRTRERQCGKCFQLRHEAQFEAGSSVCRDCG